MKGIFHWLFLIMDPVKKNILSFFIVLNSDEHLICIKLVLFDPSSSAHPLPVYEEESKLPITKQQYIKIQALALIMDLRILGLDQI